MSNYSKLLKRGKALYKQRPCAKALSFTIFYTSLVEKTNLLAESFARSSYLPDSSQSQPNLERVSVTMCSEFLKLVPL